MEKVRETGGLSLKVVKNQLKPLSSKKVHGKAMQLKEPFPIQYVTAHSRIIPRVEKFNFCLQFVGFSQKFRFELSKFGIQNQQ